MANRIAKAAVAVMSIAGPVKVGEKVTVDVTVENISKTPIRNGHVASEKVKFEDAAVADIEPGKTATVSGEYTAVQGDVGSVELAVAFKGESFSGLVKAEGKSESITIQAQD